MILAVENAAQAAEGIWRPDYAPGALTGVFTPEMCERLIAIAGKAGFSRSLVYGDDHAPSDDPEMRSSDSAGISPVEHREYYAVIARLIQQYNAEHCRFAISGLDALQVIRYRAGERFKLHTDLVGEKGVLNRKISLILQLSDPGAYEGGALIFAEKDNVPVSRAQGSGCIFPSWVPHEVHPVTSGVRYSLVTWAVGDYFR
jgi:PKHD-type hydroxylase